MNKKLAASCLALTLLRFTSYAQTTWATTLNSGASAPKFGLSTNHSLGFYTNNTLRLTLTGAGRFGIGTSDPTNELHVVGKGLFTSDVLTNSSMIIKSNFHIDHTPATPTSPNVISYRAGSGSNPGVVIPYTSPYLFRSLCDVNFPYTPPNNPEGPITNNRVAYGAQTANLFSDVIQISDPGQNAALSFAVMNGDGIIALEPLNGYAGVGGSRALKINPGCPVDVNICEGGGYTRILNGADVRRGLKVFDYGIKTYATLEGDQAFTIFTKDPNPLSPIETFRIFGTGSTEILCRGGNMASGTVLNVYETSGNQTMKLLNIGSSVETNVFSVKADGATAIKTTLTAGYALRIKNNNGDIFAVNSAGKAYAREVIVTLNSFPDYVFAKDYQLMSLKEMKQFIEKNKFLPNMPSALTVEKEGANIGEIQRVTVEKLEEAYLYIFQLEEKLELLDKKIKSLEEKQN